MKSEKLDVYQIITDRMISILESGTCPWQKPWKTSANDVLPSNFVSKKPYRGINAFLLLCVPYSCPYWVSFKQASELGGNVKKGEKGFPVVFWNWFPKRIDGKPVMKANGKPDMVPFLRYYTVFNLEQCEGIEYVKPAPVEGTKFEPLVEAARIIEGMPNPPTLTHGGNRAYYAPSLDKVNMPEKESFVGAVEYYSTLFHEMAHSTGHKSRLARKGIEEIAAFGSETYSKEELVAEMGAAFLCGHAGIFHQTQANSAAYLASWIKALKADSKLIVTAAAQAQKAADYILGVTFNTEEA